MQPLTIPHHSHVLVVDESSDSRAVICTILERHGWQTLQAVDAHEGLELARRYSPQVIVADLESDCLRDQQVCATYTSESLRQNAALVVMGVTRESAPDLPADCVVSKPYHYGPLIRKIEQLCRRASAEDERCQRHSGLGRAA